MSDDNEIMPPPEAYDREGEEYVPGRFRSVEMLRLLLTKPWEQEDLDTALISACDEGAEAVRLLLAAGANPSYEGRDEHSPLHVAAREENAECVRLLLEAGAEPNRLYDLPYCTAPVDALRPESSPEPACQEDAPMDETDMRQHPEKGDGFRSALRLLEEAGALESELLDLDSPEVSEAGLLIAAQQGDITTARAALQAGADANARGRCRTTALMKAARRGDVAMAQLLLEHGADPHLTAVNPAGLSVAAAIQAALEAKADGFRKIVEAAGDARSASGLLVTEQLPQIVETQASAVRGLSFDKVIVMGGGSDSKSGSVGGFVQNLVTGTLPLHELASSVGVELPGYLGKQIDRHDADTTSPSEPEKKA